MLSSSSGVTLKAGSVQKIALEGDTQTIKIVKVDPENGYDVNGKAIPSNPDGSVLYEAHVVYPDGYLRHHQVKDIFDLLTKVSGQLKGRYNLASFDFVSHPTDLSVQDITVGGITYGA